MEEVTKKYEVIVSVEFQKEFKKIHKDIQEIARKKLKELETNPQKGCPLKYDLLGFYSLHFHRNKYRIIYTIEDSRVKVLALHIGKRTDYFYKKFSDELKRRRQIIA